MVRTAPQVVALAARLLRLVEVSLAVARQVLLQLVALALAALVQAVLVVLVVLVGSEARVVASSVANRPLLAGLVRAPVVLAPLVLLRLLVVSALGQALLLRVLLALAVAQEPLSNNNCPLRMALPAPPLALSPKRITAPT